MSLRDEVVALLRAEDEEPLARRAAADRRLVRLLVARLWDRDGEVRARAARALGEAAVHHPDLALETVRRLLWALNDESGTNGGPALTGLGEIGRRAPGVMAPYVPALVAMAADEGLRAGVIAALIAVASSAPDVVAPARPAIEGLVDLSRPEERAALAALRDTLEGRGVWKPRQ